MDKVYNEILNVYKKDYEEKKNIDCVVKNSFPIVWFGDIEKYFASNKKIITVAFNPSLNEFPMYERRFENFDINDNEAYYKNLNNYFNYNPYSWFNTFEKVLNKIDCSYGGKMSKWLHYTNTAIHIDYYTAIATDPTWSHLSAKDKNIFNTKLFAQLFYFLNPDIILISTGLQTVKQIFNINQNSKIIFTARNERELTPEIQVFEKDGKIIIYGRNRQKPFMVPNNIIDESFEKINKIICKEKNMLEFFRRWLTSNGYSEYTPSGMPSTAFQYANGVQSVCDNENIKIEQLAVDINKYIALYDVGGKKEELGNISHRTIINALKAFRDFLYLTLKK